MRVGLLWRSEWDPPRPGASVVETCRLHGVFAAFAALGVPAEPVVYADDRVEAIREQLLALDGVLVWVNPVEQGRDRSLLDPLLRDVAAAGVWVSAHPDVILRLATKQVLVDTAGMSWGTDTRLYLSAEELSAQLPQRLAGGPRVLKQQRGMGGEGVWKVELDGATARSAPDPTVRIQHAAGDGQEESVSLREFVRRCERYFTGGGLMVEQPFQERVSEGMIRVYLTHDRVVGFAHQYPRGLRPAAAGKPPPGKVFELPTAPAYQRLRALMEQKWVPELQQLLGLDTHALPVIWDADFLLGPKTASGDEKYVLCEINASSTFAFPEHAMPTVARATLDRLGERATRSTAPRLSQRRRRPLRSGPLDLLRHVLWIGGPAGSGKTTVARAIARRHGLRLYSADAHTWSHRDRAIAAGHAGAIRWEAMTPAERREAPPEDALDLGAHWERGPMIVDDVRALPTTPLVVAEGTTVLPDIVSSGLVDRSRAIWLLSTTAFQRARLAERDVPPEIRRHRDGMYFHLAAAIAERAREHDVPVVTVDLGDSPEETIAAVERHFRTALAAGPRAETAADRAALLREANEATVAQALGYLARPWSGGDRETFLREFVCECDDPECRDLIAMAVAEFQRAAASGPVVYASSIRSA